MLFASLLADNLTHASIKVYLSTVRSLLIDHGLSDPFVNCLRLPRLLRGMKQVQGPVSLCRLPITPGSSAGDSTWTGRLQETV